MTKKHFHRRGAEDAEKKIFTAKAQRTRRKNKIFTAETHDCRDAGGRVTQGAVTERTQRKSAICQTIVIPAQAGIQEYGYFLKVTFRFLSALAPLWRIYQINETSQVSLGRPGGLLLAIFFFEFFASFASLR